MVLGIGYRGLDRSIQSAVNNAFSSLAGVSLRLATLQRINRGSDDPAGLVASEQLSTEIAAYERALRSSERTQAFAAVADSALGNASTLLNEIDSKLIAAADDSLSPEAKEALQYEVDAAIDAIGRLGRLSFNGKALFGTTASFLAGPDPTDTVSLELSPVDDSLGGATGILADLRSHGEASVASGNLETASTIVSEARSQILTMRAELGAFERSVVESAQRVMQDTEVNLLSARSAIRDADVAEEGSNLVRGMILAETSVATARLLLRNRTSAVSLLADLF